jgi:two-component system sensor histidine kinase KdpD
LQEAHSLKKRGGDVIIGFVDAHGRSETAQLLQGLEAAPRRPFKYRGLAVEEMDLDALLIRRPEVAVVDDLAHCNVPGSRHYKRYQDVLELMDAGISVMGAFDVQHLESLNDVVERAAGVTIRETIPDTFVRQADEVVALDLAIDDLRERVRAGRICALDKVEAALASSFRVELLSVMRALCLREVAESVDRAAMQHGRDGAFTLSDARVMVCLSAASPRAATLLRRGSRLAGRLNTDWYAVYVEAARESPHPIDALAQQRLDEIVRKARELGAEVVQVEAHDPVPALINFARSHGVGFLVIGRSHQPWWKRLLGVAHMDRLVRAAEGFDVHIVSFDEVHAQ